MKRLSFILHIFIFVQLFNAGVLSQSPVTFEVAERNFEFPNLNTPVSLAYLNTPIGEEDTIYIQDGHFLRKGSRIKFFGTNLVKDGNLMTDENTNKVVEQLAASGINCVRIHFIDMSWYGQPQGTIFDASSYDFDDESIRRFSYLLTKCKEHGIYYDINLHCAWFYKEVNGKNFPSKVGWGSHFQHGKGLDQWVPELIQLQKEFATNLLNIEVQPGLKMKDDPAMAMLEINNESSSYKQLIQEKKLKEIQYTDYLDEEFTKQWQEFLARFYEPADLQAIWGSSDPSTISVPYNIINDNNSERVNSFSEFIRDIEDRYYSDIVHFLKNDLGVSCPITGTQLDWGFHSMEKHFDYTDQHTYFSYPAGLAIQNQPLISKTVEEQWVYNNLPVPYGSKISGKPLTISEFNIATANQFHSECLLSFTAMAKMQDADALFPFAHIVSFDLTDNTMNLEMGSTPTQWAQYMPAAYLFRCDSIEPLEEVVMPLTLADEIAFAETGRRTSWFSPTTRYLLRSDETFRLPVSYYTKKRISTRIVNDVVNTNDHTALVDSIEWGETDSRIGLNNSGNLSNKDSYYSFADGPVAMYMGWNNSIPSEGKPLGNVSIHSVDSYNGHFVFSIFNKDGNIGESGTYVIQLLNGSKFNSIDYRHSSASYSNISDVLALPIGDYWSAGFWDKIYTVATSRKASTQVEALDGIINLNLHSTPAKVSLTPINLSNGAFLASDTIEPSQNLTINLDNNKTILYLLEVSNATPANEISIIDGPNSVTDNEDVTVNITYNSAESDNEIIVGFQKETDTTNAFIVQNRVAVGSVGYGHKPVNITIPSGLDYLDSAYQYVAFLVPNGQDWNDRFADITENNISVEDYIPDMVNEILSVEGTNPLVPGETATVNVEYSSSGDNDIWLYFQLGSTPWTVYTEVLESVSEGRETIPFEVDIPETIDINKIYQYQVFITPVGGNWNNKHHNLRQSGISVEENNGTINEISSLPISVYPNPVDGVLYLNHAMDGTVSLFSIDGCKVLQNNYKAGESVDISGLQSGLYILKHVGNGTSSFLIMKK